MRVGLVVFANKFTGAAAVAELTARALRSAGVDAELLFVAGRNLETRLQREPWAHPDLVKERTPARILANLRRLRRFASSVDVLVCHLPHDHFLCAVAGAHRRTHLVRAFRSPRHLRHDPFHRRVARTVRAAVLAHSAMRPDLERLVEGTPELVAPVPVEDRFRPGLDGTAWRRRLGVPDGAPVVGMVGKMAAGRGFGLVLDAAAALDPAVHVLLVGHGELRGDLERRARDLGIADRVHWAGHQDDGLPELYAAMEVVVLPAPGSDHGHRAVSEAQACSRSVVAVDIPGVRDLVEHGVTGLVAPPEPAAVAEAVAALLGDRRRCRAIGAAAAQAVSPRRVLPLGRSLARFLETVARHGVE